MYEDPCVVDLGAPPRIPHEGWTVDTHVGTGSFFCDAARFELYSSPRLESERVFDLEKFRDEMKGKPVLNANVRDFLYVHATCIPASWKEPLDGRFPRIMFPGTIFLDNSRSDKFPRIPWLQQISHLPNTWGIGEEYVGRVAKYHFDLIALRVIPQALPRAHLLR